MNKDVFTLEDLAQKAGVPPGSLATWTKAKLVRPAGYADDKTPLYAADALDRVVHIRKLEDLGYGPEEIQKIVKKIGLPAEGGERGRKRPRRPPTSPSGAWPSAPGSARGRSSTGRTRASSSRTCGPRAASASTRNPTSSSASSSATSSSSATRSKRSRPCPDEVRDFLAIEADLDVFPEGERRCQARGHARAHPGPSRPDEAHSRRGSTAGRTSSRKKGRTSSP